MHLITRDNYPEAVEAIRDILLMYVEMADGYHGFGHSAGVNNRFDPLKFVDAETDGKAHYVDLELLRSGSAVTIVSWYYDLWCEEQSLRGGPVGARFAAALSGGRLAAFADVEAVLCEALGRDEMSLDDPWFDGAVAPIYSKYVRGFFQRLANADRQST